MNPYEATSPNTIDRASKPSTGVEQYAIYIIQSLLIAAFVASVFYVAFPWIGNWVRPRFGSVGMSLCGNPVIFLILRKPNRVVYFLSALQFFAMGILNARMLLLTGTVSVVANSSMDRLHSSWLWCVAPCLVAGIYMAWLAARATTQLAVGEQSDGHQAADQPF
jgi:hypothetical protein